MKKFFYLSLCVFLCVSAFAQEHLTFKGIPINGTQRQFVQQLQNKGFTWLGGEDKTAMLTGDFAGYKDCNVVVATLDNKDLVNAIAVMFPTCETWERLYDCYSHLKDMLSEKYGEPKDVVEKFDSKYIADDNDRMYAVRMNLCKYNSNYSVELGDIELSIQHFDELGSFVLLRYYDKKNTDAVRAAAIDDL